MKLIITGATGTAGLNVYRAALADPAISKVTLLQRRPMPEWAVLPPNAASKTETIIHSDFLSYPPDITSRLAQHDACVWAMGKSAVGMSEADYTKLTYEYPMAFVKAITDAGVNKGRKEGEEFRFVYFSGEHADPTQKSRQMWAKVKGRTETDLISFAQNTPGFAAHIMRPAYFHSSFKYPADGPNQRGKLTYLDRVMGPTFSFLSPSLYIPVETLGKVAVEIAKGRWKDTILFRNKMLRELGL
ncbi:hypothetical protein K474DRAFT_1687236 [Panus rudis PR-1116 ss-1]|nr:hypothetical protein K474DRAFT_1687236 [Panus rudis PR-1116 ss-1]